MGFRTRLRLGGGTAEPYTVVVEPWAIEYPVPAGQPCEVVAIHPAGEPTVTVGQAGGKLVVRVEEGGSTFEFWAAGRLVEAVPVPVPAAAAAAGAQAPLPLGPHALYPPVRLVEWSPGHLAVGSRRYALLPLAAAAALFGAFALVCAGFVAYGGLLALDRPGVVAAGPFFVWYLVGMGAAGAAAAAVAARLARHVARARRDRGAVHFDRDAGELRFGPPAGPLARPLGAVAGLQLVPTTALALGGDAPPAPPGKPAWAVRLLNWLTARARADQLNLVFADGSRLNLTNWADRAAIRALAERLADFLRVPLQDRGAAEPGGAPGTGREMR